LIVHSWHHSTLLYNANKGIIEELATKYGVFCCGCCTAPVA
jgi:predicted metal-binding membrane protein